MNLNAPELLRLLEIVSQANMHNQNIELNEDLFCQLSLEYAKKSVIELGELKRKEEKEKTDKLQKKFSFKTSTTVTSKLLHTKEGDLRALRKCGELRRGYHYETGRSPKPSAIFYDLETTCRQLHDISWEEFSKPGFDIQANTNRKVARAFERARRNQKK
jgi:hypothetical protein